MNPLNHKHMLECSEKGTPREYPGSTQTNSPRGGTYIVDQGTPLICCLLFVLFLVLCFCDVALFVFVVVSPCFPFWCLFVVVVCVRVVVCFDFVCCCCFGLPCLCVWLLLFSVFCLLWFNWFCVVVCVGFCLWLRFVFPFSFLCLLFFVCFVCFSNLLFCYCCGPPVCWLFLCFGVSPCLFSVLVSVFFHFG